MGSAMAKPCYLCIVRSVGLLCCRAAVSVRGFSIRGSADVRIQHEGSFIPLLCRQAIAAPVPVMLTGAIDVDVSVDVALASMAGLVAVAFDVLLTDRVLAMAVNIDVVMARPRMREERQQQRLRTTFSNSTTVHKVKV